MNTLDETQLTEIAGGIGWGWAILPYAGLLRRIEANPEHYTWTMDWYYGG